VGDDGDVGGCRRSLESLARFLFGEMRLFGGRDWMPGGVSLRFPVLKARTLGVRDEA